MKNKEYIWRILHVPTGLYYCSVKGKWKEDKTNLSKKGNYYLSEVVVNKVLSQIRDNFSINKAQTEKHKLPIRESNFEYNRGNSEDLEVKKFCLVVED